MQPFVSAATVNESPEKAPADDRVLELLPASLDSRSSIRKVHRSTIEGLLSQSPHPKASGSSLAFMQTSTGGGSGRVTPKRTQRVRRLMLPSRSCTEAWAQTYTSRPHRRLLHGHPETVAGMASCYRTRSSDDEQYQCGSSCRDWVPRWTSTAFKTFGRLLLLLSASDLRISECNSLDGSSIADSVVVPWVVT